jgi:hypothetical protein
VIWRSTRAETGEPGVEEASIDERCSDQARGGVSVASEASTVATRPGRSTGGGHEAREVDLDTLVWRATTCCLHLLHELNNFVPVEGVTLTLHMGVGAGLLSAFQACPS